MSDFHNVLLGCMGPVKILEECVTNYIEQTNQVMEKGGEEKEANEDNANKVEESEPADQVGEDEEVNIEDTSNGVVTGALSLSSVVVLVCVLHLLFL